MCCSPLRKPEGAGFWRRQAQGLGLSGCQGHAHQRLRRLPVMSLQGYWLTRGRVLLSSCWGMHPGQKSSADAHSVWTRSARSAQRTGQSPKVPSIGCELGSQGNPSWLDQGSVSFQCLACSTTSLASDGSCICKHLRISLDLKRTVAAH